MQLALLATSVCDRHQYGIAVGPGGRRRSDRRYTSINTDGLRRSVAGTECARICGGAGGAAAGRSPGIGAAGIGIKIVIDKVAAALHPALAAAHIEAIVHSDRVGASICASDRNGGAGIDVRRHKNRASIRAEIQRGGVDGARRRDGHLHG